MLGLLQVTLKPVFSLRVLKQSWRCSSTEANKHPLRIAFFGSDNYSIECLGQLRALLQRRPDLVKSIDVVARSLKSRGRLSKHIKDLPIASYCSEAPDLTLHRSDSSSETLSLLQTNSYDLTIAVSYGKLIPRGFIELCRMGGINVHPSLLPRYSGSSPIQTALLNDDSFTGCTVQSLHPTQFDRGDILAQSDEVEIFDNDTSASLTKRLGELGARMLVEVVSKIARGEVKALEPKYSHSWAPKLLANAREIQWNVMTARQIKRLNDALGPLHTHKLVKVKRKKQQIEELQRVILDEIHIEPKNANSTLDPGEFSFDSQLEKLTVGTSDGDVLVDLLKFQFCATERPSKFMECLPKRAGDTINKFE